MITENYLSSLCKSYFDLKYSLYKVIETMCKDEGLTAFQPMMPFLIRSEGSLSVGDLSNYFNITHSNASTLCKKLEHDGLLCRTRSKKDERSVLISVTQQGEEMIERMLERGEKFADPLNEMPQEKLDLILATVDDAAAIMRKMAD